MPTPPAVGLGLSIRGTPDTVVSVTKLTIKLAMTVGAANYTAGHENQATAF